MDGHLVLTWATALALAGLMIAGVVAVRCAQAKMTLHFVLCVAYVSVIFGIGRLVDARADALSGRSFGYTVARSLPPHTRLAAGDLNAPAHLPLGYFWDLPQLTDLRDKYLKTGLSAGAVVDRSAVEDLPSLGAGTVLLPVPDAGLAAVLNAGSAVELCEGADDARRCIARARVVAIIKADDHWLAAFDQDSIATLTTGTPQMRLVTLR